jgi:hypothetical protein
MRFKSGTILTAILLALAASPAIAEGGMAGGAALAVPGPIAGAGLGFLVLAGGYYMLRRWRKQSPGE